MGKRKKCLLSECEKCVFYRVYCSSKSVYCWVKNKDMYSDKFLEQEIEINDGEILTTEEKNI